jgi:hypothetical protein
VRLILVLSGILAAVGQATHAQGPPKPAWRLGTALISVPADLRRAVGPDLEYEDAQPITGMAVDLNGDGRLDYLLQSAPSLCGNGGCIYVLCDGATRGKLGEFFGATLIVRAERVHGYPNIETYSHLSARAGTYATYSFDGKTYIVTASGSMEGAALDRQAETLRRVPIGRPRP